MAGATYSGGVPNKTSDRSRPAVRRSPNFARFIITGAVLGFVLGAVIAGTGILENQAAYQQGYVYGTGSGMGIIGLLFGAIGALTAAVIAVLIDRER